MGYFVYILLCNDGSFYTGYTRDVDERAKLHANGNGARYTRAHPPKKVVYVEEFSTRSEAMKRERAIKKLSHEQKTKLIRANKSLMQKSKTRPGTFDVDVARLEDADEILAVQKQAFMEEAEMYDDFHIPPLTETLEEVRSKFQTHVFLKATLGGKIVGSVRAHEKDGNCFVGRLVVSPSFQNRGVGTRLLEGIEKSFPACGRFELFTGDSSAKNIHLYEKQGYRRFKVEKVDEEFSFVFLEKKRNPRVRIKNKF